MAFLVKSIKNSVNTVDQTVKQTSSTVAKGLYGQQEPDEKKSYNSINPDKRLIGKKNVQLMFKFGGGAWNPGHWMVLIYQKGKSLFCKSDAKHINIDIMIIRCIRMY